MCSIMHSRVGLVVEPKYWRALAPFLIERRRRCLYLSDIHWLPFRVTIIAFNIDSHNAP